MEPTGQELVEIDDELSRFDRVRRKGYEVADDVHDQVDRVGDWVQERLTPDRSAWTGTGTPHFMPVFEKRHDAIDGGSAATGLLVTGVVAFEASRWVRDKIAEGKG